ncbi:hypothetical protein [Paenibacillus sp. FSL R10-2734]|uniref:BC1872 family protein n=1 Tax=Paenibacillus sp. FSL R10-2734 TaxID=2954691 RepID=UPI0030DAA398
MTLSREEILAKKPGKELNEHVMRHIFNMKKDPQGASFTWVHEVDGDIVDWQPAYFSPSTNISAAWEVEDQIKKLRLHAAYVSALKQVLVRTGEYVGMFDYIHANSEQRCKAALLAVLGL